MQDIPFYLETGATFRKNIQWLAGGAPVDFTGCTVRLEQHKLSASRFEAVAGC